MKYQKKQANRGILKNNSKKYLEKIQNGSSTQKNGRNIIAASSQNSQTASKNRLKNLDKNTMWIYGKHSVEAAIKNPARKILRLILLDTNQNFLLNNEISEKIALSRIEAEYVDKNYFASLFGTGATHQGCAVLVKKLQQMFLEDIVSTDSLGIANDDSKTGNFAIPNDAIDSGSESVASGAESPLTHDDLPIIFLDQVEDPQNIGSVLRAAAVFGARAVVITENHSPEITPAIAKAASGALEEIPFVKVVNLVQAINFLKKHGYWVVGLTERSEKNLNEMDLRGKFAFVIGNEGDGMRRLTQESCDFTAKLPESTATFTTLNAAQAATVTLFESCSQRMRKKS